MSKLSGYRMREHEDRGRHDGEAVSKGISGTRRVGPKVRRAWVPDSVNLDRLRAVLKKLTAHRYTWERSEILAILDAKGRGYPDLGWRAGKYEALLNPAPGDADKDEADIYDPP